MKLDVQGLSILELLMFLVNVVIASFVAGYGWRSFGWWGLVAGAICGFAILPVAFYSTIYFIRKKPDSGRDGEKNKE